MSRLSVSRAMAMGGGLALLAACASSGPPEFAAPSPLTVHIESEPSYSGLGFDIYVDNRSSSDITVTSITFYECLNVRYRCEQNRMKIPVRAGHRLRVSGVEPASPESAMHFRYSFTWTSGQL